MMKRLFTAALTLALVFVLVGPAIAVGNPSVTLNGEVLEMDAGPIVLNRTTYVCYWPVVKAMYPDAEAAWENDRAVVRAEGLELSIQLGVPYLVANGRYLYFKDGVQMEGSSIMVPVRPLAQALGASVTWDSGTGIIALESGTGPIQSGDSYYLADGGDTLHWLSQIINAESGNQSLIGKIAVGNVVLNRVNSPMFPNSVYNVVFQSNQFTPVANGTIYLEPNEESVIAAKLCLDGANTAGTSLYFVNPRSSPNSWASRNRPYVATIGSHAFFG